MSKLFKCQECGYKTNRTLDECPKCGGSDFDLNNEYWAWICPKCGYKPPTANQEGQLICGGCGRAFKMEDKKLCSSKYCVHGVPMNECEVQCREEAWV